MIPENQFYPWALQLATQRAMLQRFGQSVESFATRPLPHNHNRFQATRWDDVWQGAQRGIAVANSMLSPARCAGQRLLGPSTVPATDRRGLQARDVGVLNYGGLAAAHALGAWVGSGDHRNFTAVAAVILYAPLELVRDLVEACYLGLMGLSAAVGAIVGIFYNALCGPRALLPRTRPRLQPHDDSYASRGAGCRPGMGCSSIWSPDVWENVPSLPGTRLVAMASPDSGTSIERTIEFASRLQKALSPGCDKGRALAEAVEDTRGGISNVAGLLINKSRIYVTREPDSPTCILLDKYGVAHRCEPGREQEFVTSRVKYLILLAPPVADALCDDDISDRFLRNGDDTAPQLAGQLANMARARVEGLDEAEAAVTVVKVDETLSTHDARLWER